MRKLADCLGVEAMSLYAHVTNKDDLLNAVADRVASELRIPVAPREHWQQRIRESVAAWVRMQQTHPGGFPLLYRNRRSTEWERRVTEEIMDALSAAGFGPPAVALGYQTLVSFLDGALLHWPRESFRAAAGWASNLAEIDAERYPRTAESAPYGVRLVWEEVFYQGLDLFLRGLEESLARRDSARQAGTDAGARAYSEAASERDA